MTEWLSRRRCTPDQHPLFFSDVEADQQYAKAICGLCPVMRECRADAVERQERYGIFGGLTPKERGSEMRHRYK